MPNESNSNKPTIEELKAQEDEAIKLAEELENNPPVEEEEEPEIEEEVVEPEEVVEEEEEAEPSEEEKEALKQRLEEEKKKSSASARENQKIYAKNRVINKALTDAEETPEPTEEELAKEFTDWEFMSDIEKTLAKETVISRNWRKVISQAKEQATKIEKWNESVEEYVDDPETLNANPELEGKTNEFKEFATQEANNNVPFNILVGAFLHEKGKGVTQNKGKMFEKGSGGPNDKPQPKKDTITLEEARKLRETDYPRYKEMLIKGLIETDL